MIVGWQLVVMLEFLLMVRWSLLRVGMGMVREREKERKKKAIRGGKEEE